MQVAAVLTPSVAPHVAAAIIGAYGDLRGRAPPTKNSWLWPLALSANETASWRQMFNWNVGNVTTTGDTVQWYFNPSVGSTLRFRSFSEPRSAALAMLKALDQYGGVASADAGDSNGWQYALNHYLGSTYPPLGALISVLSSVQPEGQPTVVPEVVVAPVGQPSTLLALTALALAGAAGYGIYKAMGAREPELGPEPYYPEPGR